MKNIAYYISDHGYGHAARSISIIKGLVNSDEDISVTVNCSYPLQFIIDNLVNENRVKFRRVRNDFGYYTDEKLDIDKERTKNLLDLELCNIDSYVNNEKKFCEQKDIDLIVSDIGYKPFKVSEEVGLPSIGISNFTWWEVYKDLLGDIEEVNQIKDMYEKADLGLMLPMETEINPFSDHKKIGLVSRSPTKNYSQMRHILDHNKNKALIYFSHGKSVNENNGFNIDVPDKIKANMSFISFHDNKLIDNPDYIIPQKENDVQNYIEASDLVVSKFGYSTAAEAIRSGKPMILTSRDIIEDRSAIRTLKELDVVKEISRDDFLSGRWLEDIEETLDLKENYEDLPKRFRKDGKEEVISHIQEFI